MKRSRGVKDSGSLLPGHGGALGQPRWYTDPMARPVSVLAVAFAAACGSPQDRSSQEGAVTPNSRPVAANADTQLDASPPPTAKSPEAGTPSRVDESEAEPPTIFAIVKRLPGLHLLESESYARHVHGGSPANIHETSVRLENIDGKAHKITVRGLEFLRRHCRSKKWNQRRKLEVTEVGIHGWNDLDDVATGVNGITVPKKRGLYSMQVRFPGLSAYQACDGFGYAIELEVDGDRPAMEIELHIKRFEALRDRTDPFEGR